MINVDLSKAFHPRFVDALVAFLPGLFFEASLLLANPQLVTAVYGHASLDRYTPLFVALLMAFVLGSTFMAWVGLVQTGLFMVHRRWEVSWPKWVRRLYDAQNMRRAKHVKVGQPMPQPTMYSRFLNWANNAAFRRELEARPYQRAWMQLTKVLLDRYHVAPPRGPDPGNWKPWVGLFGGLRRDDLRGYLLTTALEATGWSGLAARLLAPALHDRAYTSMCVFLILFGMLQDRSLAHHSTRPVGFWLIALRNVFSELKKAAASADAVVAKGSDVPPASP